MTFQLITGALSIIFFILGIIFFLISEKTKGERQMNILKEGVVDLMDELNQEWVKAVKEADGSKEGFDPMSMFSKFSEMTKRLDKMFEESKARLRNSKKGFFQKN